MHRVETVLAGWPETTPDNTGISFHANQLPVLLTAGNLVKATSHDGERLIPTKKTRHR